MLDIIKIMETKMKCLGRTDKGHNYSYRLQISKVKPETFNDHGNNFNKILK